MIESSRPAGFRAADPDDMIPAVRDASHIHVCSSPLGCRCTVRRPGASAVRAMEEAIRLIRASWSLERTPAPGPAERLCRCTAGRLARCPGRACRPGLVVTKTAIQEKR
jgi:hypothetical protein